MDRSIRIFRQLEQVFEPYRILFKELKERKSSSHHSVSAKKMETPKNTKTLFSGTVSDSGIFAFHGESWNPTPRQNEGWMYSDAASCLLNCVLYQLVKYFP
jgi:hypothetical protein